MKIRDDKMLKELQEEFNYEFPFLKIEFYRNSHRMGQGSPACEQLSPMMLIGDIRKIHNAGYVNLDGNLTVGALEQTFRNIFDLNVQVFRKSFGRWVQSWSSDSWTLKEQNLRGMLSDEHLVIV
jgi:hypothetical protein